MQINSHDLVAWPLFARLAKQIKACREINVVEELRKIAVKVDTDMLSQIYHAHDHIRAGRSWDAIDTTAIRDLASALAFLPKAPGGNKAIGIG